jgi:hypothetical protein
MTSYVKLNPEDMNEEGLGGSGDITPELIVEKSDEPIHSYRVEVYLYLYYIYTHSFEVTYSYVSVFLYSYVYICMHMYIGYCAIQISFSSYLYIRDEEKC